MGKKLTEKRKDIIWAMIDNFQIARFEMEQFEEYEEEEVIVVIDLIIKRLKLE
jgi:hypothetical protein